MSDQIAGILDDVYKINSLSRFGFTTFGDKPIDPLGYQDDYCLHVDKPLGRPEPQDMQALFAEYTSKAQGGGNDWAEGVFEGLLRAMVSPAIGWDMSEETTNIIVVVTDAVSHMPGDVFSLIGVDVPANDVTSDSIHDNENNGCADMDYPSIEQVAEIAKNNKFQLIFLTAPGGTYDAAGKFWPAKGIALKGKKYRNPDGLAQWYHDVLTDAGVQNVIVKTIDPQMNVYAEALIEALNDFKAIQCTTTEAPTEASTTTADSTSDSTVDPTADPTATTLSKFTSDTTTHECKCNDDCDDCCHGELRVRVEVHLGEPGEEPITNVTT